MSDGGAGQTQNEAFDIERRLEELLGEIADPHIAGTVQEVWESFQNKKVLLADLAFKDPSTGLFNKFYFDSRLEEEIGRALRYKRELTVLVVLFGLSVSAVFSRSVNSICGSLRLFRQPQMRAR